jgi:SpoVK/Ycf46/Vps4 family AAA+-type ATPase
MASADQLKALLESHTEGDDSRFFAVAMQVAAAEARKGHTKLSQELRALIDKARANPTIKAAKTPTPIASPRGGLADLLSVSYPKVRLSDMTLDSRILARLKRVLKEQRYFDKLRSYGLSPRRKLLLTGPPGCGKTMTASALAGELGVPLFVVRLDGLITKYMGESISKLRLIFDAMEQTRAVYLFDEFDSIGTHRGFVNDVGEIKRVLNSFLMFIEQDASTGLVMAATNHPQSLDYALFRRFDELIEYELPTADLIEETLKNKLCLYERVKVNFRKVAAAAQGFSYAEITQACEEAVKDAVLNDRKVITTNDVLAPLSERAHYHERYTQKE